MSNSLFEKAHGVVSRTFIEEEFGHPNARWLADNYQTVSPLRGDEHPGSFSIRADGVYYDRAFGDSGDIIDLYSKKYDVSPAEAARRIIAACGGTAVEDDSLKYSEPRIETEAKIGLSWVAIPEGKKPSLRGTPDYMTLYHVRGVPAFYVVRYNARSDNERKIIHPVYWTGATFASGLPEDIKKKRPLLLFDARRTIVIVEGEKCVEEARAKFPMYEWTTWHGGAANVNKVDLAPLVGCDVIVWPDLDEPGAGAADYLCKELVGVAGLVRRVIPPLGKPKGWDVADAIEEGYDVLPLLEVATVIEQKISSAEEVTITEPRPSTGRAFTDLGNAERFVDQWGHIVRFNVDKQKWLVWLNGRWDDSDQSIVTPMIKRTIRSIAIDNEKADAIFWARASESSRAIRSMMTLAQNERGIPVSENNLDQHLYYVNCPNGVVDMRSGELLEPKPEFLCTKVTRAKYNPEASCPVFMKFIKETFMGDDGLINFVQRWIGYSLTADVSAQTFAMFYGIGANGKSTLVETIQRIAGDYVKTAPPETFVQKHNGGGIPNDIAALRGARMVLTTETEANARLAEAKVKSMTGGDRVSARYMRGEFFEFSPTWKITISTNHRPRISGGDYGIWRRVVLVPFSNIVTPDKQDPLLQNKLMDEAEGILSWCVKGAVAWYTSGGGRIGLQVPEVVYAETQEYREDEDIVGRFIANTCMSIEEIQRAMANKSIIRTMSPVSHVYFSYRYWCEQEGEYSSAKISQNMFSRMMRERGYNPSRFNIDGVTARWYEGLVIKPQYLRIAEYGSPVSDD